MMVKLRKQLVILEPVGASLLPTCIPCLRFCNLSLSASFIRPPTFGNQYAVFHSSTLQFHSHSR